MKSDLTKQLLPIVEKFVNSIIIKADDIKTSQKSSMEQEAEWGNLVKRKEEELDKIKQDGIRQKKEHDDALDKLEAEKNNYIRLADEAKKTTDEYKKFISDNQTKNETSRINFLVSEDNRKETEKIKKEVDKIKTTYTEKIRLLGEDEAKNAQENDKIALAWKKIKSKSIEQDNRDGDLDKRLEEVANKEIDQQIKQKRIDFEYKKLKLKD